MNKKRIAQERAPGTMSAKLGRRMGDRAELFDEIGQQFYADAVLAMKDTLTGLFQEQMGTLSDKVKEEFGRRGLEESAPNFSAWMNELVGDLVQFGMEDVSGAVEDLANSIASEYIQDGEEASEGDEEGEELFEVEPEEIEEVTEEEVEPSEEEPAEGEEEEGAEGEEALEDLFAEEGEEGEAAARPNAKRPRKRRSRPARQRRTARPRRKAKSDRLRRKAREIILQLRQGR